MYFKTSTHIVYWNLYGGTKSNWNLKSRQSLSPDPKVDTLSGLAEQHVDHRVDRADAGQAGDEHVPADHLEVNVHTTTSWSSSVLSPSTHPCGTDRTLTALSFLSGLPSPSDQRKPLIMMAMHINVSDVTSFWEEHLSEDNRPGTDKKRQVVRVKGVKIILLSDGKPEDHPDGAVDRHVDNETSLWGGRQGGFGVVGRGSLAVDLLFGAAAVRWRSRLLQLVTEGPKHLVKGCPTCSVVALKEP